MRRLGRGGAVLCVAAAPVVAQQPPCWPLHTSSERVARRFHRSIAARSRNSTWKEKTSQHEEKRLEAQAEAAAAAERNRRRGAGTTMMDEAQSSVAPPPGRRFFGLFRQGRKMPLNPLLHLRPGTDQAMEHEERREDTTSRLIQALREARSRATRRGASDDDPSLHLSEQQCLDIVYRHVQGEKKWYHWLYRPFRKITSGQVKWWKRIAHLFICGLVMSMLPLLMRIYRMELETVAQLTPQDRTDYVFLVTNMRYSDLFYMSREVLQKEDPLEALPMAARYHVVLDEARRRGWCSMDWETELRKTHERSPVIEMDVIHLVYWAIIYFGNAFAGGGAYFENRLRYGMEVAAEDGSFVQAEPTALPTKEKGFFS